MTSEKMDQRFELEPARQRRLYLRPGRGKSITNRHPWVFEGSIVREEGPENAAIGVLFDADGKRIASGFYSRHSQIRLRILEFGDAPITEELVRSRIVGAIGRREALLGGHTDSVRLIHSEGDLLSGLIVDRYGDVLVVEIGSAGLDRLSSIVESALQDTLRPRSIIFHNDASARRLERLSLETRIVGEEVPETIIRENGLGFHVSFVDSQKTGFFLDQRDNRALARELASGRDVLNLFSYSGGFGVYASSGGAVSVDEVDSSSSALELGRRNHALNGSEATIRFADADAFQYVRGAAKEGRSWDLLICDPPAFARSRGEVDRACRGYKDINLHVFRLARPGAMVMTFSCSGHVSADLFQKVIFAAALDAGREVSIVRRLGAGVDHPVSIYCPEGEYLKGLLLRVER